MMITLCNAVDCVQPATWTLHLKFWALGQSPGTHEPAMSTPIVSVCDAHKTAEKKENWYTPSQRVVMRNALLRAGYAEPDFDTADIEFRPILRSVMQMEKEGNA